VKSFPLAAAPALALALALSVASRTGVAQEAKAPDGQAVWRSCAPCHCVPDARIPEDAHWLKLNETTTCIAGERDTPETRRALIAYLRAETTVRPLLVDEQHAPATGGTIRLPATAGSAYLKAERPSVRAGSPPKIRLRWKERAEGTKLRLPPGEYRVVSYGFYRTDEKGRCWIASGSSAEGCAQIVIRKDEETTFDLLPELQAHLECKQGEKGLVFGFTMTNRKGRRMSLSRDGSLVNPTWVVRDAEGSRIDAGAFEVT